MRASIERTHHRELLGKPCNSPCETVQERMAAVASGTVRWGAVAGERAPGGGPRSGRYGAALYAEVSPLSKPSANRAPIR